MKILKKCKSNSDARNLDLEGYLVKPVQRICKYPLFLRELCKEPAPSDAQLQVCQKACESIENFTRGINEKLKNTLLLTQIQSKLGQNSFVSLLLEGRRILLEGRLWITKKIGEKESLRETYFWLLDNLILWRSVSAKIHVKSPNKFTSKMMPLINILSVEDDESPFSRNFYIRYQDHHCNNQCLKLSAATFLEKTVWMCELEKII